MTVLVPNTDEEARRRLPATGDGARLTWSDENIHMVREAAGGERRRSREQFDTRLIRDEISAPRGCCAAARRAALSVSALVLPGRLRVGDRRRGGDGEPRSRRRSRRARSPTRSTFANWPLYIEEDRGTLKEFEKKYGAKVKYVEEINDNAEFFGKVRQQYDRGDSGGATSTWSPTGWPARMIRLGYVQKFDHGAACPTRTRT